MVAIAMFPDSSANRFKLELLLIRKLHPARHPAHEALTLLGQGRNKEDASVVGCLPGYVRVPNGLGIAELVGRKFAFGV